MQKNLIHRQNFGIYIGRNYLLVFAPFFLDMQRRTRSFPGKIELLENVPPTEKKNGMESYVARLTLRENLLFVDAV